MREVDNSKRFPFNQPSNLQGCFRARSPRQDGILSSWISECLKMYSRIALTQQGPFRQLHEKRHKKTTTKTRRFRNKQQKSRNWTVFTWKVLEALSQKNDDKENSPKKGTIWCTEMRVVWFAPCHFPPNPISASHEAQSFATTMLEMEPCWMDRAVQVPQRILVLQEGILQGWYKKNHGNPWDLLLGGSNLQQIYG